MRHTILPATLLACCMGAALADDGRAAAEPSPSSLAARAIGSAGAADRALRARDAPDPDTPTVVIRAERTIQPDKQHRNRTHGFSVDRYVSPDGVSVTRQTNRDGVKCFIGASFAPRMLPRSTQAVNCPPDDEAWQAR